MRSIGKRKATHPVEVSEGWMMDPKKDWEECVDCAKVEVPAAEDWSHGTESMKRRRQSNCKRKGWPWLYHQGFVGFFLWLSLVFGFLFLGLSTHFSRFW